MFRQAGKYIADTLTKLSIETVAGWVATMIGSALVTWWISADPRFPVESRPALAIWFLVIALALGVLWVLVALGVRYFRRSAPVTVEPALSRDMATQIRPITNIVPDVSKAINAEIYNDLVWFCVDQLIPACNSRSELHADLINSLTSSQYVAMYARRGADDHYRSFGFFGNYEKLSGLLGSPAADLSFEEIIDCVDGIEKSYETFCGQAGLIAGGLDYKEHPRFGPMWEVWRETHNEMVEAYEKIRRDVRFGKLHRLRPSRWGGIIPPVSNVPQSPQDTEAGTLT